jgi:hypothetical protein
MNLLDARSDRCEFVRQSPRFLLGVCLILLGPPRAGATSITASGQTTGLTASPPGTFVGYTGYRFSLKDYFPPSNNPLPEGVFTENELSTNLVLIGGFGPAGPVDPIVEDQSLDFDITGEFWRHHLTLMLHAKSFPIFSSDTVGLKGFVQHLVAPHPNQGEVAPGAQVNLEGTAAGNAAVTPPPGSFLSSTQLRRELQRHGVDLPAEGRYGFDANSVVHPNGTDEDTAIALLVGHAPGANAETFDWYEAGTAASHPVPEPSGFTIVWMAAVLLIPFAYQRTFDSWRSLDF